METKILHQFDNKGQSLKLKKITLESGHFAISNHVHITLVTSVLPVQWFGICVFDSPLLNCHYSYNLR